MNFLPPFIWPIASVEQEPKTSLMDWRVFEVQLKDGGPHSLHVVGYAWRFQEGRVTSAILAFDTSRMTALSSSGRVYELQGDPGYRGVAELVWREWLAGAGAQVVGEVTDSLLEAARSVRLASD